jgi:hypothetical protein
MIFPPKEATEMSRDIKYIGVDVHQEAIVIAVAKAPTKENRPDSGAASCFVGIPRPGACDVFSLTK